MLGTMLGFGLNCWLAINSIEWIIEAFLLISEFIRRENLTVWLHFELQ